MGQQQLLLIMLTIIVIGAALAVGINVFTANAIEQKRNEVINECVLLASEAQRYFKKPIAMGGGGKSFVGWIIPTKWKTTEVGSFEASIVSGQQVIITGTGNEVVTDSDSIKVQLSVTPGDYATTIIN